MFNATLGTANCLEAIKRKFRSLAQFFENLID